MDASTLFLQKRYTLTTNDFDCYDRLTPAAILNYFQDIAGRHAEALDIGFTALAQRGYYWILTRNVYEIVRPLENYEDIIVSTWPHKPSSFDFTREYEIHDRQGNLLIKGQSKWLVIDKETHQIQRSRVISYGSGAHLDRSNFTFGLDKLDNFDLVTTPAIYQSKITHSQIDHNGHMNNAQYAYEILNALAPTIDQVIDRFEINYLGEMYAGDILSLHATEVKNEVWIEGAKDGQIKVRAKVRYQ